MRKGENEMLFFLVFFPMIAAVCSYLVGRKNKALRDRVVQLCCLGQQGLIRMAELSMERGHALAEGIKVSQIYVWQDRLPFCSPANRKFMVPG